MHELALTRNIVATAAEAAGGQRVARVSLVIGRLSGVSTEAIRFAFDAVAAGTPLAGARLDIAEPDGRARCAACGAEFATPDLLTRCACGSLALTRLAGEELLVSSIDLAETR